MLYFEVNYIPPSAASNSISNMLGSTGLGSNPPQSGNTMHLPSESPIPAGIFYTPISKSSGGPSSSFSQGSNSAFVPNASPISRGTAFSMSQGSLDFGTTRGTGVSHTTLSASPSKGAGSSAEVSAVFTFDGVILSGDSSGLAASPSTTIFPGGTAVTISGHVFSLGLDGSSIAVDGAPTPLSHGLAGITWHGTGSSSDVPQLSQSAPMYTPSGSGHAVVLPVSTSSSMINHLPPPNGSNSAAESSSHSSAFVPPAVPALGSFSTGTQTSPTTSLSGSDIITSTDSVEPSDVSTEATTNTAWTDNFWLTTQVAGQTTVVPVVVGCSECGGKGGGIVLWNFPPIPRVSFKFPKLKLPSISFPCIPIPLIKKCSTPPNSECTMTFHYLKMLTLYSR